MGFLFPFTGPPVPPRSHLHTHPAGTSSLTGLENSQPRVDHSFRTPSSLGLRPHQTALCRPGDEISTQLSQQCLQLQGLNERTRAPALVWFSPALPSSPGCREGLPPKHPRQWLGFQVLAFPREPSCSWLRLCPLAVRSVPKQVHNLASKLPKAKRTTSVVPGSSRIGPGGRL